MDNRIKIARIQVSLTQQQLGGQWNNFTESCGMIDYKKIETLI